LQRIRDYHNPLLNPDLRQSFETFIHSLIGFYLSKNQSKAVEIHLKELAGTAYGNVFAAFLKKKLSLIL